MNEGDGLYRIKVEFILCKHNISHQKICSAMILKNRPIQGFLNRDGLVSWLARNNISRYASLFIGYRTFRLVSAHTSCLPPGRFIISSYISISVYRMQTEHFTYYISFFGYYCCTLYTHICRETQGKMRQENIEFFCPFCQTFLNSMIFNVQSK